MALINQSIIMDTFVTDAYVFTWNIQLAKERT